MPPDDRLPTREQIAEIHHALDAAEDDGYPTAAAHDVLAELVAENARLREALEAIRELPDGDDRPWAPEGERWRSVGLNAARIAREILDA